MTITQLILLLGVATVAFGPNEIPKIARALGSLTGQAAGVVFTLRRRMSQLSEHTEIHELNKEVQASMMQINRIRSELQSGVNIFNPGPVASRIMATVTPPTTPKPTTTAPSSTQPRHATVAPSQQQRAVVAAPPSTPTPAPGVIPLSAVAAGLAPDRAADTPSGGQIVLDALMEEHVARQAKAFYRDMAAPPPEQETASNETPQG